MNSGVSGIFAALVTPQDARGGIDFEALDRLLPFLVSRGVDGLVVGGCTGEYPHFDLEERKLLLSHIATYLDGRATLLVGIGASSLPRVLELGRHAAEAGSRAVLIPMPYFYRYGQEDLEGFSRAAARSLPVPCLLYNLPCFTNGLEVGTIVRLLESEPNLVGIKDSSGDREVLASLKSIRGNRDWTLLVGDDALLLEGLFAGWDGGVSGGACVCPEVIVGLHRSFRSGDIEMARRYRELVDELSEQISPFPTPWGIRLGLEVRGLPTGPLPLPVADARRAQIRRFQAWFEKWLATSVEAVVGKDAH